MIYQLMLAIITPALISGAFAERMKFSAMLLSFVQEVAEAVPIHDDERDSALQLVSKSIVVIVPDHRGIGIGRIAETISDPRFREDIFRLGGIILDLLAQHPDVGSQVLQLTAVFGTPDGPQQFHVRQRSPPVLHHER